MFTCSKILPHTYNKNLMPFTCCFKRSGTVQQPAYSWPGLQFLARWWYNLWSVTAPQVKAWLVPQWTLKLHSFLVTSAHSIPLTVNSPLAHDVHQCYDLYVWIHPIWACNAFLAACSHWLFCSYLVKAAKAHTKGILKRNVSQFPHHWYPQPFWQPHTDTGKLRWARTKISAKSVSQRYSGSRTNLRKLLAGRDLPSLL